MKVVGLSLEQKNTYMKENIPIETKITMALTQLSSWNSLQMCGEVYDIVENIASIIVK